MTDVDWTSDLAIRLVEEYRLHPELWDCTHDLYRVQTAKYEAWSDMARIFECDIADLRKKLNSIFASHRREKAKIRSGGRSTWFLYPYLRFLPSHLETNSNGTSSVEVIVGPTNNTLNSQQSQPQTDRSDQSSEEDDDEDRDERPIMIKQEPVIETYCIGEPRTNESKKKLERPKERPIKRLKLGTRPLLNRKIVKDNDSLDNRLLETLRLLRKSDLSRKKDECDSFGDYIAISLRKHDERTQSMIKQAINNILFEQEMKKYSAGQFTVVLSGVDENPLVIGDSDDK